MTAPVDSFDVTGSWDKASYVPGDTITGTISGNDVVTTETTVSEVVGPVTVGVVNPTDGAKGTYTFPATSVDTMTQVATSESVVIDTTVAIVDNGPKPRTWTVAANGLSITATA